MSEKTKEVTFKEYKSALVVWEKEKPPYSS
jgi:hypothetical protein